MRLATLLVACLAGTAPTTPAALAQPAHPPEPAAIEPTPTLAPTLAPARTSPFDAIFIDDDGAITVRVERAEGSVEGRLVSIGHADAGELAFWAQVHEGADWKRRLAEDLADTIEAATGERPGTEVRLVVEGEHGREAVVAAFSAEKRRRIYTSDYGDGPRIDALRPIDPRIARATMDLAAALLEARWSYRHLHPDIDVRTKLHEALNEVVGASENNSHQFGDMVIATMRVLAMFPDGHAGVSDWGDHVAQAYLPAMAVWMGPAGEGAGERAGAGAEAGDRVALMNRGEDGVARPVDGQRPYLVAIDGVPLERWLAAARLFEPKAHSGNDWDAAKVLRFIPLLRRAMGLEASETVLLTLAPTVPTKTGAGAEGVDTREIELALAARWTEARPRPWLQSPAVEPFDKVVLEARPGIPQALLERASRSYGGRRTLEGGVGYLQLTQMDDAPETIAGLVGAMEAFCDAPGLVFDVRGNRGGSRLPLLVLWRYLAGADEAPRVVALARPILGPDGRPQAELGGSRYMHTQSSVLWSQPERRAIASFAEAFEPQWTPDGPSADAFGPWHYLVLGGRLNALVAEDLPEPYHFDKPVVVLMDGDCFSATSIFLAALTTREDVTLVGTPAHAGSGRTRGHLISEEPELEIRLSTMASFQPDGRLFDGNVIEPDIVRWPTLGDLAGETDTQLDAALEVLRAAR